SSFPGCRTHEWRTKKSFAEGCCTTACAGTRKTQGWPPEEVGISIPNICTCEPLFSGWLFLRHQYPNYLTCHKVNQRHTSPEMPSAVEPDRSNERSSYSIVDDVHVRANCL